MPSARIMKPSTGKRRSPRFQKAALPIPKISKTVVAEKKESSEPRRSQRLVVEPVPKPKPDDKKKIKPAKTPKVAGAPKAVKPTSTASPDGFSQSSTLTPAPKVAKTQKPAKKVTRKNPSRGSRRSERLNKVMPEAPKTQKPAKKVGSRIDQQKAKKVKSTTSSTPAANPIGNQRPQLSPTPEAIEDKKKELQALVEKLNKEIDEANKETADGLSELAMLEPLEKAAVEKLEEFDHEERTNGWCVPELVNCGLCKKSFGGEVVPKVMSCGHTLCNACIQQRFAEVIVCATCNQLTFVPADKLGVNIAILQHNEQVVMFR